MKSNEKINYLLDRIIELKRALKDCMFYIDVDNLTMQSKMEKWKNILEGD